MKKLVEEIGTQWTIFIENANAQVEKGNKTAGVRARKASLELTALLKKYRQVSIEESKK